MRFRILGPLEVGEAGASATPRAAKLRSVLATLLVRTNEVVSVHNLIDELWGSQPPRTAVTTLQVYVSQLRKLLEDSATGQGGEAQHQVLITRSPGYVLRTEPGEMDLAVFEDLHERGRRALDRRDFTTAATHLREALDLWRGPALSDVPRGPILEATAVRLSEARVTALEQRIRADLYLGRHQELIAELQAAIAENPLREELHGHLMVALYRSGRQVEALQAFGRLRKFLVNELAIEPTFPVQRLHQRILKGDPLLLRSAGAQKSRSAQVSQAWFPAPAATFVGRSDLLGQAQRLLRGAASGSMSPACVTIVGKPGVGKSTLAVQVAHQMADTFPDGRVFLSMQPAQGRPLTPIEAMVKLLRRAGFTEDLPAEHEELRDLVQQLLDGQRLLLIVDDASSEAQVRPLLPTGQGCAVLVTSRRMLAGLGGAPPLILDVLRPDESLDLLGEIAGKDRIATDPDAAAQITELCGHLPLAVRIAGARLAGRRHWTAPSFAARLSGEHSRLGELQVGDLDMRASLMTAYRDSSLAERRTFRLLSLLPPGGFDLWAAAAVLGVQADEAEHVVERLVDAQMLDAAGPQDGKRVRYQFHELLRVLATECLNEEEGPESTLTAVQRMCTVYLALAQHADNLLMPGRGEPLRRIHAEELPVHEIVSDHPLQWFAENQSRVVHSLRLAHRLKLFELVWLLADSISGYLEACAGWNDWEFALALAIDAAQDAGDDAALARAIRTFGRRFWQRQELLRAESTYNRARELAEKSGDKWEYARTLAGIADLRFESGAIAQGEELLREANAIAEEVGDLRGQLDGLRGLALAYHDLGRLGEAVTALEQCLTVARTLQDRRWEAYAMRALQEFKNQSEEAPPEGFSEVEVRPGVWTIRQVRPGPVVPDSYD